MLLAALVLAAGCSSSSGSGSSAPSSTSAPPTSASPSSSSSSSSAPSSADGTSTSVARADGAPSPVPFDGDLYQPPDPLPAGPAGTVLRREPLAVGGRAKAWRVLYLSQRADRGGALPGCLLYTSDAADEL